MARTRTDVVKEREEFVVMRNDLIRNTQFDLTAQQMKIILYIISKIMPNDGVDTWYTIEIRDLCRCCGIKITESGVYYNRLKTDLKKLTWRNWHQLDSSDTEYSISWIGDVKISKGSGTVSIIFNPFMEQYLFMLRENYTQYELQRILTFTSKYSIRLYMLLKSFCYDDKLKRNIPQTITLDLDRLRGSFVNRGYEEWRDFSRRILNVGVSEINEKSDDFHLEMDTVQDKMTNKVVKVKFILTSPSLEQTENARAVRKEKLAEE